MVEGNLPVNSVLIIITGPTAVGKTDIAIGVAEYYNTEIISADSRQFYSGLKIGTAVPDEEQLAKVKHHFIGNLSPEDYYNVSQFEQETLTLLKELFLRHQVVVLTGGSGLYIQAITNGIDDLPDIDPDLRNSLIDRLRTEGLQSIRETLSMVDPDYAVKVDPSNPSRILRALEVSLQTGMPYSSFLQHKPVKRDFDIIKIALNLPREELHNRINFRVDQMIKNGLIEEAREFYHKKHLNALNTVGYKELFDHFDGKSSLSEAIEKIKTNSRRYARRQITWFKKDKEYIWLRPEVNQVLQFINEELKRRVDSI